MVFILVYRKSEGALVGFSGPVICPIRPSALLAALYKPSPLWLNMPSFYVSIFPRFCCEFVHLPFLDA
jgi:hypothetical protein